MNGDREMELHYINSGFPYAGGESFMDFFGGLAPMPLNYPQVGMMHGQEREYWSMNMHAYRFEMSGPGNSSYYTPYEVNDFIPRRDMIQSGLECPSTMSTEEIVITDTQSVVDGATDGDAQAEAQESLPSNQTASSSQLVWQDNIDPDNMTYEELLELGEAVGTESRGLSEELISLLPTSKYTFGNIFSRKKSGERCVICQMRYKRGDRQIKLPCKHIYHSDCISKWLTINKICPVCNVEVFGEESRR